MSKEKSSQRAIICLYLRKRHARKYRERFVAKLHSRRLTKLDELCLATLRAAENEAHNALESLKRALSY